MNRMLAMSIACAMAVGNSSTMAQTTKSASQPLTIQEQGSFAAGGKVTTAPGASIRESRWTLQARPITAITLTPSIRFPSTRENIRSSCGMAPVSSRRPGKPPPTVAKASRTFSCAEDLVFICSISPAVEAPAAAWPTRRSRPRRMSNSGSTSFASGCGRNTSTGCSSHATTRPATSSFRAMTPNTDLSTSRSSRTARRRCSTDRARHSLHTFAGRRSRMVDRHQERECQERRRVRTGQQLYLSRRRSASRQSRVRSTPLREPRCHVRDSWP